MMLFPGTSKITDPFDGLDLYDDSGSFGTTWSDDIR